jgi:hypothetical protein
MPSTRPSRREAPAKPRRAVVALGIALAAGGCAGAKSSVTLPSFQDVDTAPAAIQAAAQAVVLVNMPTFSATAVFISPDGLLLTNNHVLGVSVCPVEGCYVELTFGDQRGAPVSPGERVFAVPQAVNVGLDVAILQVTQTPGGAPLSTPAYVTIDSRGPTELLGTHINLIGHPENSIKKWTAGEVVDTDGNWIWTSAFDLPGNSGSPILDDHGHLVGIVHRGPDSLDLVTGDGLNDYSIGSASAAIIAAMSEPLPGSMWSTAASTTSSQVTAQDLIYLAAQQATATVGGTPESVLTILGAACDAALAVPDYASPEDLSAGLQPCFDAESWIACAPSPNTGMTGNPPFNVCPSDPGDWQRRYQAVFEYWRSFNGELELDEVSFAIAALSTSATAGTAAATQSLTQALGEAQAPLDFIVAFHLAAFDVTSYQGTSVALFIQDYRSVPDYALNGEYLVSAILWLDFWSELDDTEMQSLLSAIHGDPTIDLGTKLFIEQSEYQRGILP